MKSGIEPSQHRIYLNKGALQCNDATLNMAIKTKIALMSTKKNLYPEKSVLLGVLCGITTFSILKCASHFFKLNVDYFSRNISEIVAVISGACIYAEYENYYSKICFEKYIQAYNAANTENDTMSGK